MVIHNFKIFPSLQFNVSAVHIKFSVSLVLSFCTYLFNRKYFLKMKYKRKMATHSVERVKRWKS
jgi:hypothetical protein